MATIDVKDAAGSTVAIERPLAPGRGAASASRPVVLSTEDKAVLDAIAADSALTGAINETAPGTDTASSGLNGRLQRVAQRLTSLIALLPASLGSKTSANSLAVVVASDQSNVPTKVLLTAGVARQLTTTGTSANTALTAGIKAVSIHARNSDARFLIGNSSQTASSSSHFIASGERIDLDVSGFATPNIGIIYGPSAAAAILEISELS